jgi:outer membrane lipoprotein-sorting protein
MMRLKFILGIFITLVVTAAIIDKDPAMPSDVASEYNKINTIRITQYSYE